MTKRQASFFLTDSGRLDLPKIAKTYPWKVIMRNRRFVMIPCNCCKHETSRNETSPRRDVRDESPISPSSTPSRTFPALPATRARRAAALATRKERDAVTKAHGRLQSGAPGPARGRIPPRRRRRVEVGARGACGERVPRRRQAWWGSTGTLGEPSAASGRRPSAPHAFMAHGAKLERRLLSLGDLYVCGALDMALHAPTPAITPKHEINNHKTHSRLCHVQRAMIPSYIYI